MVCGSLLQAVTLSDTMMVNRYVKWQFVNKEFQTGKESEQEWKWRHHSHIVKTGQPYRAWHHTWHHTCTWRCCPLSLVFRGSLSTPEGSVIFEAYSSIFPCAVLYQTHPSCTRSEMLRTPSRSPERLPPMPSSDSIRDFCTGCRHGGCNPDATPLL